MTDEQNKRAAPHTPLGAALIYARKRIEALEAENARLRVDAARYKWLRDHSCPPHNFYISVPDEFGGIRYTPDEVDTYIDAARAALGASHD